jgi:hypothetical protein
MNTHSLIFLIILTPILVNSSGCAHTKQHMLIDPILVENSEPMKVNRKNFARFRMQFGKYSVTSGRRGVMSEQSSSAGLFRRNESYTASQSTSFVFTVDQGDTLGVGIDYFASLEEDTKGIQLSPSFLLGTYGVNVNETTYYSSMKPIRGDKEWEMLIVFPLAIFDGEQSIFLDPDMEIPVSGVLTDGEKEFTIFRTERGQDGKRRLFNPRIGYTIYYHSFPVAAVQTVPIDKQMVWIHDDLDEELKTIMATTAATLMIISMP